MDLSSRAGRFQRSFRSRLFLIFTFFTFVISILFVLLYIKAEVRNYRERSNERAQLLASQLAVAIRLPLYAENFSELTRHAGYLLASPKVMRIIISGNDSRVFVDMKAAVDIKDSTLVKASAQVMSASDSPSVEDAISGAGRTTGLPLGVVTVFIDTSDLKASIISAIFGSAVIALLFWIAVLLTSYPVLKRVTGSFETLTTGLNRMMNGDFSFKIEINEDTEAGMAAQAVNKLSSALNERELENRRLQEELVNSMRMEVQEEKRQIMAKLIQTNRMTSLGLLISSMAHNINTPNGAIKLAAQHLERSWQDALPILEQVTKEEGEFTLAGLPFGTAKKEIIGANTSILSNADKVERVIKDLRAYNIGEKSEFCPGIAANNVVNEALTIIRAHGRQGEVTILSDLASDLPYITGNKYQLEQVVVNLLMNAMQASESGKGVVSVRTEYDSNENNVRIKISDKGIGIPPEVQKHLFEAFFSTRIESGGSGLGLYISRFIVNEHKGRLTLESDQAGGTVATIYLPVTQDA